MDMVRRLAPRIITDKDARQPVTPLNATDNGLPLCGDRDLAGDLPLRGEIFSIEQLQRHARVVLQADHAIPLVDDASEHVIEIELA